MDFINYTLFTIGGDTPVLLIDLLTSVVGLTCVFLAGRNSKYNFWVGYLYSLLLLLMFWNKNLYANLLLQPISLGINVLGHYRWTHPRKEEFGRQQRPESDHARMETAHPCRRIRIRYCSRLGLVHQPCRQCRFPRQDSVRPDTVSRCLRDRAHPRGAIPVSSQEMGLLDCLASGQCVPAGDACRLSAASIS